MATATSAKIIPVHLYDGRREISAGNIKIHPDLHFKQFQFNLSQLLGISYNNVTTYLIDHHNRRKILITGKVNFAVFQLNLSCYFLVVLKRSRRDRRRKVTENSSPAGYGYDNDHENEELKNYMSMIYSSSLNDFPAVMDVYGRNDGNRVKCEKCLVAVKEGKVAEFHCCVYDERFYGFVRSPYGPIGRKW